jgi:UPF0148 protein
VRGISALSTPAARTKITVELMRKGAAMLKEPCPVCNGVQVRYKGRVYCTNHEDLSVALQAKELIFADVTVDLRNLLITKLRESMAILEKEGDEEKLGRLVSLMTGYIDLLAKLEPSQRA